MCSIHSTCMQLCKSSVVCLIMQGIVTSTLRSNARDRFKVEAALKYCKAYLCTLKGEERRKVHVLMLISCDFCTLHGLCMQHANPVSPVQLTSTVSLILYINHHRYLERSPTRVHEVCVRRSWQSSL